MVFIAASLRIENVYESCDTVRIHSNVQKNHFQHYENAINQQRFEKKKNDWKEKEHFERSTKGCSEIWSGIKEKKLALGIHCFKGERATISVLLFDSMIKSWSFFFVCLLFEVYIEEEQLWMGKKQSIRFGKIQTSRGECTGACKIS